MASLSDVLLASYACALLMRHEKMLVCIFRADGPILRLHGSCTPGVANSNAIMICIGKIKGCLLCSILFGSVLAKVCHSYDCKRSQLRGSGCCRILTSTHKLQQCDCWPRKILDGLSGVWLAFRCHISLVYL